MSLGSWRVRLGAGLIGLAALALASCPSPTEPPIEPAGNCPPDSAVSWENTGEPFLRTWCSSCHGSGIEGEHRLGAPDEVNLDSRQGAVRWSGGILLQALLPNTDGSYDMPPLARVPEAERLRFKEWLACGAP